VTRAPVSEQAFVARHESQPELARDRDEHPVRRVAVEFAGEKRGLESDARGGWRELKTVPWPLTSQPTENTGGDGIQLFTLQYP